MHQWRAGIIGARVRDTVSAQHRVVAQHHTAGRIELNPGLEFNSERATHREVAQGQGQHRHDPTIGDGHPSDGRGVCQVAHARRNGVLHHDIFSFGATVVDEGDAPAQDVPRFDEAAVDVLDFFGAGRQVGARTNSHHDGSNHRRVRGRRAAHVGLERNLGAVAQGLRDVAFELDDDGLSRGKGYQGRQL